MKRGSVWAWGQENRVTETLSAAAAICREILPAYERFPDAAALSPLSGGLINDTYRVEGEREPWVLQRLNPEVFPDPLGIMANLRLLLDHAHRTRPQSSGLTLPAIRQTLSGADFWVDAAGVLWRGLALIPNARNLCAIRRREEAVEVGRALGWFHGMTESLPCAQLKDTLPGFHETPRYLALWGQVLAAKSQEGAIDVAHQDFIEERQMAAGALEAARASGSLKVRVMHGDPKLDNVLFSQSGLRAISLIDLDTVKPGLIHYDLGDCLRSCCNAAGESGSAGVRFDAAIFEAVLEGYFLEAAASLTPADLDHISTATWLLPYELGVRFLTDHLEDDRYFKVAHRGENLERALRQFALVKDIERQQLQLERAMAAAWARV